MSHSFLYLNQLQTKSYIPIHPTPSPWPPLKCLPPPPHAISHLSTVNSTLSTICTFFFHPHISLSSGLILLPWANTMVS